MSDVLSIGIDFERSFLEELVSDLKGTFHCILHAGKYNDRNFIKDRQEHIKKKYEKGLKNCLSFESWFVDDAYTKLQDMLRVYKTHKDIKEMANEALYNDLMEGIIDEDAEIFREEHASTLGIF